MHGSFHAGRQKPVNRIRGTVDNRRETLQSFLVQGFEHVTDHFDTLWRSANANSHSTKIGAAHRVENRLNTTVTAGTASGTHAQPSERQIEVIINDQQIRKPGLQFLLQRRDRLTAAIHEGLWFS